jgi:ferredoxin-NADP reductase
MGSATGEIELCIEELPGGEVSPFFHEVAAVGDDIELRGPLGGHFVWTVGDPGPVLLIGGGSGIVPLMSIARHRAAMGSDAPMVMLFSARSWKDVIFRDELLELHGKRDGFELVLTLTRDVEQRDGVHARRVDSAMVMEAVDKLPALPQRVYVCGSNPFVDTASDAAIAAGIAADMIRTERYGG